MEDLVQAWRAQTIGAEEFSDQLGTVTRGAEDNPVCHHADIDGVDLSGVVGAIGGVGAALALIIGRAVAARTAIANFGTGGGATGPGATGSLLGGTTTTQTSRLFPPTRWPPQPRPARDRRLRWWTNTACPPSGRCGPRRRIIGRRWWQGTPVRIPTGTEIDTGRDRQAEPRGHRIRRRRGQRDWRWAVP